MNGPIENYVQPLYLQVLHGNFMKNMDKAFVGVSKRACKDLSDEQLLDLLGLGWREAITASWVIGLKKDPSFTQRMKANLLPSRWCFSGQFHLIALARIPTVESRQIIMDYLDEYLPVDENHFDQLWAYGALNWVAPDQAAQYDDDGLWKLFENGKEYGLMDRSSGIEKVHSVMTFIEENIDEG